ncbi:GGDEF domain-containing protein [Clostridium sp. WILCCON 0269]|uniref:GGDEF domain-containing protein n=1 Tax=Candidatus Clostridium eludens TaxID=3381663 RepID=A0ABW8SSC8_9CLOT
MKEQAVLLAIKAKELSELKEINCKLESLSLCDGLTGILNRRGFDNYLSMVWKSCIRSGKHVSLIMADIDYFKTYNDTYGHPKGDECLIKVAKTMASSVKRPMDFVARYGGEEFAVILPETDGSGAIIVAEKIKKAVQALSLIHKSSQVTNYITISLGVTTVVPNGTHSMEKFISNADKALYKAKSSGRNTVNFCNE